MHRLLPSSVIAGVSVVCAVGPWLFTEPLVLRGLAAGAALTTILGAVVMRRWDVAAGKHVADLTRARASDEWRHEERVAELETDLEESRELRTKLEQNLRAKRTELAKLRNEHAALLRRYATAETERATALEGRRLLAIESAVPARALPAAGSGAPDDQETPGDQGTPEDLDQGTPEDLDQGTPEDMGTPDTTSEATAPGVFSPAGSALFLKAGSAMARLVKDEADPASQDAAAKGDTEEATAVPAQNGDVARDGDAAQDGDTAQAAAEDGGETAAADGSETAAESAEATDSAEEGDSDGSADAERATDAGERPAPSAPPMTPVPSALSELVATQAKTSPKHTPPEGGGPGKGGGRKERSAEADAGRGRSGEEAEAEGHSEAVAGREHEAAPTAQQSQPAATRPAHGTGHFTVPTAVAVVPAAPPRRPAAEGGFDFFGTKSGEALASVHNEDLADVVGQEALAMHKAEAESGFKPADPQARGVGQIIDLTAHDETEQIDVQGLRTAAS
ncbi:hypothetical protein GCM10010448_22730 [Streptomyces glomeratus]|uniref:Secreted protein n=1 Tax=Streptomyces glomeratus TaxID=284452 RepID=A0ABP6LDW7_9ACTN|nr:hypothetical protein [Streptomyces glomeratus]